MIKAHRVIRSGLFVLSLVAALALSPSAHGQKISIMLYDARIIDLDQAAIDRFRADHPGVEVELIWSPSNYIETVLLLASTGEMPDVVTRDLGHRDAVGLDAAGYLLDLHPYVEAHREHFAEWYPGLLDAAYVGGRLPAIPRTALQSYVNWYNIDHFDRAGIPHPDGRWDWEEFRQIAKRLTRDENGDGVIDVFGYDKSWNYWQPFFRNAGVTPVNHEAKRTNIDSPEALQAMLFLRSLRFEDRAMPTPADNWGNNPQAFAAGKTSILLRPSLFAEQASGLNTGVALEPFAPGTSTRNTMLTLQSFMISSQSKHPDLAFELILYLTDETTTLEHLVETGTMVVYRSLNTEHFGHGVNVKGFRDVFQAALEQPVFFAYSGVPAEPWELLDSTVVRATENNDAPIESIVADAVPRINRLLAEQMR